MFDLNLLFVVVDTNRKRNRLESKRFKIFFFWGQIQPQDQGQEESGDKKKLTCFQGAKTNEWHTKGVNSEDVEEDYIYEARKLLWKVVDFANSEYLVISEQGRFKTRWGPRQKFQKDPSSSLIWCTKHRYYITGLFVSPQNVASRKS